MKPAHRSAVFVGVARNCATWLPGVLDNLQRMAGLYERSAFIFVVSDSTDDSSSILTKWLARGRQGEVIDLGVLADRLPLRTERIAHVRNFCLDRINASDWTGHDHLIVTDLDDVMAMPVSVESFEQAIDWLDGSPSRAAVFANAEPRYYDIWALRHDQWCPGDCWHRIWGRPSSVTFEAAKFREVFARQFVLPRDLPPVQVRSAFGGLGVYRLSYARNARYVGIDEQGRESSEHVAFNEAIGAAGGELHIFPALQVHAPGQHLYRSSEFKWRWRATMMLRRMADQYRPPWRRFLAPS